MKKTLLLILFNSILMKLSYSQILCVQCFEQNDSIGINLGINNIIINGGFENTTCGWNSNSNSYCPNSLNHNCNITNWTCSGGGVSTYASFYDSTIWFVPEGVRAPYFGNSYSKPCSVSPGDTNCLSNSGCIVTGIPQGYPKNTPAFGDTVGISLSQTATGLIPGNTYILEFWAGGEQSIGKYDNKGMFAVDVGFGNTFLRCKPTIAHIGIGTRYLVEFNAISSSQIIKFTNWGHICDSCTELILDDVRLYSSKYLPPNYSVCAAGIDEIEGNEVNIYPNPINEELTIKTNSFELTEITIYDLTNMKVLQQTFRQATKINTQQLQRGIYIYSLKYISGFVKSGKVIRE